MIRGLIKISIALVIFAFAYEYWAINHPTQTPIDFVSSMLSR